MSNGNNFIQTKKRKEKKMNAFVFTDILNGSELIVYEGAFTILKSGDNYIVRPHHDNVTIRISREVYNKFRNAEASEY